MRPENKDRKNIMDWKNRVYCGDLTPSYRGKEILLMGWVDAIRDHGNVIFIHLRDIRGIVQVVFDPGITPEDCCKRASTLREEYVIKVRGTVAIREKGTENPNLETGTVEVVAQYMEILSMSAPLPFQISEKAMVYGDELLSTPEHVEEELRLKYRYLDLRRPSMQKILLQRHEIIRAIREYLYGFHFTEIETPFLTRSTPEGARDYLVPSRIHQGCFYALPQSPQLFKQILMMSGMDRYFQIVRCFRDEDLRPNRQPEFTQLDLEASFIDEEFIYELLEGLISKIFAMAQIELPVPFPRMTYAEAMDRYGSDRPDLRFGMSFVDVSDILKDTNYSIFKRILADGGRIKGLCVKGQANALSKNVLQNEYALKIVPGFGAKGMTWMKVKEGKVSSNIVQFFTEAEQEAIIRSFNAENGDVLMMIADQSVQLVNRVLCSLRLHVAERLGLIPRDKYSPVWVTAFPLFELKDGKIRSQHHPFTMPDRTDFDPEDIKDLLHLKSRAYDIVINGEEIGGGSVRIHDMDIQRRIFRALGMSQQQADDRFGFFLKALTYGAPPHAGLALGMDRTISMILNTPSIRDVIAFPKNRRAVCPLTNAPAFADKKQLDELGLVPASDAKHALSEQHGEKDTQEAKEKISKEEVRHVAKLARLELSDDEIESYQKDLNAILEYVETIKELDTSDTEPMTHVMGSKNVWRTDEPGEAEDSEMLLVNAPERENNYFKVPRIVNS